MADTDAPSLTGEGLSRLDNMFYQIQVSRGAVIGSISKALGGISRGRLMHSVAYGTNTEFADMMDDLVDDDKITLDQWNEILHTSAMVRGVKDGKTIYALAEISLTASQNDIDRAAERAAYLQQATGAETYPIVVGDSIPPQQQAQASSKGVTAITVQQRGH